MSSVKNYLTISIDGNLHGLVHYHDDKNKSHVVLVELDKGKVVHEYNIPSIKDQSDVRVRFADGNKFFVIINKTYLHVIDKISNELITHQGNTPINVVTCHPEEQIIVTGEILGRMVVWKNIFSEHPYQTVLHWHHMIVLSLAFSQAGTILYSGGAECVLVKWEMKERAIDKNFLPRVSGSIKQIAIDPKRDKLSISIDDNSIQIINSNLNQLKTIQDFTSMSPFDLVLNPPFAAGIRMNPKMQCLALNGRIGHLQFFSMKTMKLLYNVDITMKNVVPRKRKSNQFSTDVTLMSFSACGKWMATIEMWYDRVNSVDSRLKFWKFHETKQTYALHTQIEQPHASKPIALEFSTDPQLNICVTTGLDRVVKVWSLEASEEIENPKMIWMLIKQLKYKNLQANCLNFSHDSSLLAVGFGNSLCIWDTDDYALKCALSAPPTVDGSTNRVIVSLPLDEGEKKSKKKQAAVNTIEAVTERRKKMLQMMHSIITDPDSQSLVNDITKDKTRTFKRKSIANVKSTQLSKSDKKLIFNRVLASTDLNFNEKLQIFHKLNIYYNISNRVEEEVFDFLAKNAVSERKTYVNIQKQINDVKNDAKYNLLWRFRTWKLLDCRRNRKIITVRKLLKTPMKEESMKSQEEKSKKNLLPIKNINHITNTIFCANELSHLCIVTTQSKILIWNLLTLKIQGSFRMQTQYITLDPLTNLIAVFTKSDELFVFQPSPAMVLYHKVDMPKIYGTIWIPQEYPKNQSLGVNWQAASRLIFITHDQEVCGLQSSSDDDLIEVTPVMTEVNKFSTQTPFASMMSKKSTNDKVQNAIIKRIAASNSGTVKEVSESELCMCYNTLSFILFS
jgi:NET1-associated nuclear protein 1 (U3 small nucleolar RNA-associated protein 17)